MSTVTARGKVKDIRVLVADDSMFMRHLIKQALAANERTQVVGEARDGCEAVNLNAELSPDVVLLDVQMPKMDGLQALRRIMAEKPVPVVMFSSLTERGAQVTLEALSLGAVDFMAKPESRLSIAPVADELCRKIITAASARLRRPGTKTVSLKPKSDRPAARRGQGPLVVIGSSTGGPQALDEVIPRLGADLPGCVIICQHMPAGFTASMAKRLDGISEITVREAADGEELAAGTVLIAPGGAHLKIVNSGPEDGGGHKVRLDLGEPVHGVRPSVDVTLMDAGPLFGPKLMVVIMTGMGSDGARGAKNAKEHGATVVCQDEGTSVVWGMPRACVENGACDRVVPLPRMAGEITRFALSSEESAR